LKTLNRILLLLILLVSLTSFKILDNNNMVRVSPMPIKTTANVYCDYAIQKIEVYNLLGIQVVNNISEGVVDFSNLPSGYYIVKVYTNKGEFVKRVQKN
jgi:hypothetical protein